jgi:hypothetical protein
MAFPSVYEMTNPLTTVRKQHFWEYFSGATLNSRWTTNDYQGTATFSMNDEVDGGFNITGGGASLNSSSINFNDKRQYAHNGSVCIVTYRRQQAQNVNEVGMYNSRTGTALNDSMMAREGDSFTYKSLFTRNASADTTTASDVPIDTNWTNYKMETNGTNVRMWINGVLKVTTTSTMPTAKMQPVVLGLTAYNTSGTFDLSIKYMECYNT